jgi:uncharacterized repeat protein (TIGR01451 family)
MKLNRTDAGPRRALFLMFSALLVMFVVLGTAQLITAQEDEPVPVDEPSELMQDKSAIYADRMQSANELDRLLSPVERYNALESISGNQLLGSDLSNSSKEVNLEEIPAGSEVEFTIVIDNSGDADVTVAMTDTLPAQLAYVSHELQEFTGVFTQPGFTVDGDNVMWGGAIASGRFAQISIIAKVKDDTPAGTMISNTAEISGGGQTVSPQASFRVKEPPEIHDTTFPLVTTSLPPDPPEITNLAATRPNSQNEFTLSWQGGPNASRYEVQMDHDPGFPAPSVYDAGRTTSMKFKPEPSFRNEFYFRVRSFDVNVAGKWSDTVDVVGAYYDSFDDRDSGWKIRRTTYIEKVKTWYEIDPPYGRLVLEVRDKWDWGISSPLARAPEPPYVIEYDGKFAQTPNEVAMGIVFGGDRPDEDCPDTSSAKGMYRHTRCFNHFYNPQYYWAGEALHLLWYRTDELVWCSGCGGSPMKRLGDSEAVGKLDGVGNDKWNRHRIEVREDSIRYYAGRPHHEQLKFQYEYNDTRWINEPYFGVFAYAGEYTSSVAVFDYFSITPLDN